MTDTPVRIEAQLAEHPHSEPPVDTVGHEDVPAHPVKELIRELWRDKAGLIGVVFLVLLVLSAIFAGFIAPHDPGAQALGRDVLSRIIHGSRISLIVGVSVVALAGVFGTTCGLISGYVGGRTDRVIMGVVDTQVAFPGLLLALIILAVVGPSITAIIVVLSFNGWMVYARMTRSTVLTVRETPYVEAAEMVGCRPRRVIFKHILPNLTAGLMTLGVLEFARIVLAEAALSFLGLGIQPPATSWGLDVANGRQYIFSAWWLVTFPGVAIAATVLAVNLVASWLRVISDPQEREKRFAGAVRTGKAV
jgi:ABC-type dipeptide/oligopeptide/nickel transport system permease subunit